MKGGFVFASTLPPWTFLNVQNFFTFSVCNFLISEKETAEREGRKLVGRLQKAAGTWGYVQGNRPFTP